jgi:hypothetical protein
MLDGFGPPPPQVLAVVARAREVMEKIDGGSVTYTWRGFPETHKDKTKRVAIELNLSIESKN